MSFDVSIVKKGRVFREKSGRVGPGKWLERARLILCRGTGGGRKEGTKTLT